MLDGSLELSGESKDHLRGDGVWEARMYGLSQGRGQRMFFVKWSYFALGYLFLIYSNKLCSTEFM